MNDCVEKKFEKEFKFGDYEYNTLKVYIKYCKGSGYFAHFSPYFVAKHEDYSTQTGMIMDCECQRLTYCNRKSKKAMNEAIEKFNSNVDAFAEHLNKRYNLDIKSSEIIFDLI